MDIYNSINVKDKNGCVLCLGNFDGVHTGHKQLILTAKKLANELKCPAGIYTFSVNSKILLGNSKLSLITTDNEKNRLFSSLDVDFVCYDDFLKVKDFSPEEFCAYIKENTNVKAVVCGENFTFGKFASANSSDLKRLSADYRIICEIVKNHILDNVCVSSTVIRKLITDGDMDDAAKLLGYRYFIETEVVHGAHLGSKLGFPTINQNVYGNKTVPSLGVYCCKCIIDGEEYMGVVNVGTKPTVTKDTDEPQIIFETNILDFSGDLYGKKVKIEFYKKLRNEIKFSTLEELTENVLKNINETRAFFRKEHN